MATILISGGSGLIGRHLTPYLAKRGHSVIILTRKKGLKSDAEGVEYSHWNVDRGEIDRAVLRRSDHIIHLAGAGVVDKKWTEEYRREIVDSRTKTAALILKGLREADHRVQSFVSAGAIGYYGPDTPASATAGFEESDVAANDFLAQTCLQWEAASEPAKEMGLRRVVLRQGIVLANGGGAYQEYKLPLKFGVAPIFGNGKQNMSWIHVEDVCRMYGMAVENDYFTGVYNAVAPEVVTQKQFMIRLGKEMRGRFYTTIHVPAFLLALMMGKRSIELLKSAKVSCKKIKQAGFQFLYPTVPAALADLNANG